MHLLMHLCERKKRFIKITALILFEVINIDFQQIWHFDVKGTRVLDRK